MIEDSIEILIDFGHVDLSRKDSSDFLLGSMNVMSPPRNVFIDHQGNGMPGSIETSPCRGWCLEGCHKLYIWYGQQSDTPSLTTQFAPQLNVELYHDPLGKAPLHH